MLSHAKLSLSILVLWKQWDITNELDNSNKGASTDWTTTNWPLTEQTKTSLVNHSPHI